MQTETNSRMKAQMVRVWLFSTLGSSAVFAAIEVGSSGASDLLFELGRSVGFGGYCQPKYSPDAIGCTQGPR